VFLHGGWRCGSTYVWSKFRQLQQTVCYYEPFHEILATCSSRKVRRDGPNSWNSRHPALSRPYRHEYLPLLGWFGRGVRGYRDDLAVGRFFPSHSGIGPEVRYLSGLLEHATRTGKQPVLGFSRSLARAALIKQALGGYHVVIRRNPVQQWLSCRSYRVTDRSVYFELCHLLKLALAPQRSPAGRFASHLGLPRLPAGRPFQRQYELLREALWPWSDEFSYRAFLGATLLSYEAAIPEADLLIDIDRLSEAAAYRQSVTAALREQTGLEVTFDDCHSGAAHDPKATPVDFARVQTEVRRVLRWNTSASVGSAEELVDGGLGAGLCVDAFNNDGAI
jgi:hypothetical protein